MFPTVYTCLANWKLFLHENQTRSISVGKYSLPLLNNAACRAWIIDDYGEWGGGMSFLRDI